MFAQALRPAVLLLLWLCAACAPIVLPSPQPSTPPTAPLPTPTTQTAAAPSPRPTPSPSLPSAVDKVYLQVERLRGIEPRQDIPYAATTQAEVAGLTQEGLLLDWPLPSLEREVRLLRRFGLSEPGMQLEELVAAIGLDGTVAAAVPGDGLAISTDLSLTDADLVQVACVYERLLLTRSFPDAFPGRQTASCLTNVDACLANRALLAGDAALLAEQWLRTFGSSSVALNRASPGCTVSQPSVETSSRGLVPVLTFPQAQGVSFARALFLKAGWAGVDQAYASPPVSTEQILHPDRYPKDVPRPPVFPDPSPALGMGWTTEDSGVLGEWRTRLVLQAYLDPEEAVLAAAGWDGDHYALLANADLGLSALVLLTRWDTVRDAHEFSGAFRTYGESRFGPASRSGTALTWTTPSGMVILDVGNDQTLWIEAPDAASAATLRKSTGFPLH
jgi:hypothetical protein